MGLVFLLFHVIIVQRRALSHAAFSGFIRCRGGTMNQQRCDYVSVPSDKRTSISLSDKKRKKKKNQIRTQQKIQHLYQKVKMMSFIKKEKKALLFQIRF